MGGLQPRCANPKGIAASSPRLRGTSYLGSRFRNKFNRNAVAAMSHLARSIPNVFLIPFDFVSFQQRAQLALKTNLAVMLLLSGDVLLHRFEIGLAHGEIRVAALPLEVGVIATAFLQPEVRDAFQFLHPFGLRDGASEARKQMNMIFHAANKNGRAIELFRDATEIRMERVARGFVAQERTAVFGGENQVNVNGGKRLWHVRRMPNRIGVFQSQRDCVLQPRVGRNELPWEIVRGNSQPQRGCGERRATAETGMAATPLGLMPFADGDPG